MFVDFMWQLYGKYFLNFYYENKLLENMYASKIKMASHHSLEWTQFTEMKKRCNVIFWNFFFLTTILFEYVCITILMKHENKWNSVSNEAERAVLNKNIIPKNSVEFLSFSSPNNKNRENEGGVVKFTNNNYRQVMIKKSINFHSFDVAYIEIDIQLKTNTQLF